jgi:hypothetical protein
MIRRPAIAVRHLVLQRTVIRPAKLLQQPIVNDYNLAPILALYHARACKRGAELRAKLLELCQRVRPDDRKLALVFDVVVFRRWGGIPSVSGA